MNRNLKDKVIIFIILFMIFYIFTRNEEYFNSINFSISLWKNNLFPTLFPFLILSNILIYYDFPIIIGKLINKPFKKLFNLNSSTSYVLITSLIAGFPSGSINTIELLNNDLITKEEGNKLLTFTNYANPIFIIGFIGNNIFYNKKIGYIILISTILSGIITGLILNKNNKIEEKIIKPKTNKKDISNILKESINKSLNTMFLLLGVITIFSILISIINNINMNSVLKTLFIGLIEMTNGIKSTYYLNISNYLKTILITIFITFSGLSIHMQVISIISDKLKYKYYLEGRIIHSIISIILVSILYLLFI